MTFIPFLIALLLIVGLGYLSMNINWKQELADMIKLFKRTRKI